MTTIQWLTDHGISDGAWEEWELAGNIELQRAAITAGLTHSPLIIEDTGEAMFVRGDGFQPEILDEICTRRYPHTYTPDNVEHPVVFHHHPPYT
ncbi:hypothetical protein H8R18_00665 [Nanchangia anserum]|uniref:Uncharacterized protein n=1 Tax=Nanchangia anserum TaxID=2692125 RepID=A0A8I0GD20_9ACTO|nr:hypothetical protein [Nanchangia anserum]MBD3689756.1 hypothetical protein [Nanchangia anserum]QOX81927.1 hypothetical protein H8R18_00665 [Nanchangia anserum]